MPTNNNELPSNFPTPPAKTLTGNRGVRVFPEDLISDGREFYLQIQFVDYDFHLSGSGLPTGGIILPIPLKLNEQQIILWEDQSMMNAAAAVGNSFLWNSRWQAFATAQLTGVAAGAASRYFGLQLNPFLWAIFKHQTFKEFIFSWILTATNEKESEDIAEIIKFFKYNSLPFTWGNVAVPGFPQINADLVMNYPSIAIMKLFPNNAFTFRIKPCAVLGVHVDYSAAGQPSFFKNGAPTMVRLDVHFKEIELWTKNNYFL